jgi:serine/threonine-protein kinase HipA
MMLADVLKVYLREDVVGELRNERGKLSFQYAPEWVAQGGARLSRSLPVRAEAYPDFETRAFFANLLPESRLRTQIAEQLKLSRENIYGLLAEIGGECAGAVRILEDGEHADHPVVKPGYRALSKTQLAELIALLPSRPFLAGAESADYGVRLSLAGAQNKLPVKFEKGVVSLPLGDAPSTHILKPQVAELKEVEINEAFCMRLAKAIGLDVPDVQLLQVSEQWVYLIARYDRKIDEEGRVVRLHQEDFCQALGIPPDNKYENDKGPSFKDCMDLLEVESASPAADQQRLLQWMFFNLIIGNADAHAKNIALLQEEKKLRLAPFYDLLSTAVYPGLNPRMAMKIGGKDDLDWIHQEQWERFSQDVGVGMKTIEKIGRATEQKIRKKAIPIADKLKKQVGDAPVLQKILTLIDKRAGRVMRSFTAGR